MITPSHPSIPITAAAAMILALTACGGGGGGGGGSGSGGGGNVGVDVNPAPPIALNGVASTPSGRPVSGNTSAFDPDGDALTYLLVDAPTHGVLSLGTDGRYSYTPAAGYVGGDRFTFKARDARLDSNLGTVSITVTAPSPTNRPPVANPIVVHAEPGQTVRVALPVADPDGDTVTSYLGEDVMPYVGTVSISGNVLTFAGLRADTGTNEMFYYASDGRLSSNFAMIWLRCAYTTAGSIPVTVRLTAQAGDPEANVFVSDPAASGISDPMFSYSLISGPAGMIIPPGPILYDDGAPGFNVPFAGRYTIRLVIRSRSQPQRSGYADATVDTSSLPTWSITGTLRRGGVAQPGVTVGLRFAHIYQADPATAGLPGSSPERALVKTAVTASDGSYRFDGLICHPDRYLVCVTPPPPTIAPASLATAAAPSATAPMNARFWIRRR